MFLHCLKYDIIKCWRNKMFLFWLVLFPVILGAFFKIVFGDIYEKEVVFHTVPVAIVKTEEDPVFDEVIDSVTSGEEPLFAVTECSEEHALSLLKEAEISGIIYADDLSMTVSTGGIEQTIIKSFLEQYKVRMEVITEIAASHPEKLEAVITNLSADIQCNENIPLTKGNMDTYVQYFYNLIAMVALYGSITGLHISIDNQSNLSHIGARNNCSPVNKLISAFAELCGSCIAQSLCVSLSITYLAFVLQVDFADRLPFVYLSGIISGWVGVSMGFFVGSIGKLAENAKVAVTMAFTMFCCFLSGLMMGDIKADLAASVPWVNKINPAAVISDSFYCLNVYEDFSMYTEKIVTMLILTAVFTLGGFLLTRRRKYASL